MNRIKRAVFRGIGLLRRWIPALGRRAPYTAITVSDLPDKLEPGSVYLVGEGGHLWSAALKCPGGCGNVLEINLVPDMRPLWHITVHEGGIVTVEPSIWRQRDCRCHFRITNGQVRWY